MDLGELNNLDPADCKTALTRCCGATKWVDLVVSARPYEDMSAFNGLVDKFYSQLEENDWLEAFTHHPRIGDVDSLREKFATTAAWSGSEQGQVTGASDQVLVDLKNGNDEYFDRFGFIFIVCATGKSAGEMLSLLNSRLNNTREQELAIAAEEQRKIMHLRLEKLLT